MILSWKGYNFDVLDSLTDAGLISHHNYPRCEKSVLLTDKGNEQTQRLTEKYGIENNILK